MRGKVSANCLLARLAGQWTNKNLDSSEAFSLGGAGLLAQLELRGALGRADDWAPYAFYDAGRVRFSTDVFQPGLGLRDASGVLECERLQRLATQGGAPQSDSRDSRPRLLVAASWRL